MREIVLKRVLPVAAGGILGYAYYHFIGCNSGSCAITNNPYISTIYGAVLGLIFAFPTNKRNEKKENN